MTPDEVAMNLKLIKDRQECAFDGDNFPMDYNKTEDGQALSLALRVLGRIDSFELSQKQLSEIIMFIRRSMFLPENDKMAELNKLIKQAILQSLIVEE